MVVLGLVLQFMSGCKILLHIEHHFGEQVLLGNGGSLAEEERQAIARRLGVSRIRDDAASQPVFDLSSNAYHWYTRHSLLLFACQRYVAQQLCSPEKQ